MKIIISGSRKYTNYEEAKLYIDLCIKELGVENPVILSGGCKGADMIGERYAAEKGFVIKRIDAQWSKFGKAAGPIRNKIMATECDVAICFWDSFSVGTKSMIDCLRKENKKIFIKYI